MAFIIRTGNGEIKTYSETADGIILEPGESLEETPLSLAVYSHLLRLSVDGRAGELVQSPVGTSTIQVEVDCPGETRVDLDINGLRETIPLVEGKGNLTLSGEVPGMFVIAPAERTKYCAAGEALCIVEVLE
jgi:hypothetical protein